MHSQTLKTFLLLYPAVLYCVKSSFLILEMFSGNQNKKAVPLATWPRRRRPYQRPLPAADCRRTPCSPVILPTFSTPRQISSYIAVFIFLLLIFVLRVEGAVHFQFDGVFTVMLQALALIGYQLSLTMFWLLERGYF